MDFYTIRNMGTDSEKSIIILNNMRSRAAANGFMTDEEIKAEINAARKNIVQENPPEKEKLENTQNSCNPQTDMLY